MLESEQARKKEREFIEPMQQTFKQFSCSVVFIGRFFDMALPSLSIYCKHLFLRLFKIAVKIFNMFFFSNRSSLIFYRYKILNTSRDFIFLFTVVVSHLFCKYYLSVWLHENYVLVFCRKFYMQTTKLKKRHISCCPIWVCLLSRIQFSST